MAKSAQAGQKGFNKADLPKAKLNLTNLRKSLRLFTYLGKNKWKFALGMFFLVGTAAVGLIFPLKAGSLFSFLGKADQPAEVVTDELQTLGVLLLIILTIQSVFSFGRTYFFSQVTENILKGLRDDVFRRIVQMPMGFFARNQSTELNSRMATDINVISEAFTFNIAELIRQAIVGVGGLILMVKLTPFKIAMWFLAIIPAITVITLIFAKKIRFYSKKFQDKIAELSIIVGEALTGISNVKVFTNEHHEMKKYSAKTEEIKDFGFKYGLFRGAFFAFVIAFIFGAIFFILYLMVRLYLEKELTGEQFGQFLMLSLFVAASLGGLPEQIASIQRALGATDRVFELIDGEVESIDLNRKTTTAEKSNGEIEFRNVSFNYPSRPEFAVLKDINFRIEAGQTVALVGSSGSGKSTIASLILRFYDPSGGQVFVDGKDSRLLSLTDLRAHIALVPQDVILFAGTIRDNIAYGRPDASEEEIREAARQANAYSFIESFPDKFNTIVGERGIQLSGGQRQRIAIARAVLKNPSILILDEATSSLDSESERLVQEALDKLMVGRTSVVIAHRLSTIRNADRIIVLSGGMVQESGPHHELIQNEEGLYHKLSKMQFELS